MFLDQLVHLRLRQRWLIAFVVTVPAVAKHVDDHIFVKLLAEVVRQPRRAHARLGIVTIHVEDRRLHRLGHVGGVRRRARRFRPGGEADLIVDHDVHCPASAVAFQLRQVQRLRDDALPGESGVAVNEKRKDLHAFAIVGQLLLGAGHSFDDRIDRFEMARIRGQRQLHRHAAGGLMRSFRAEVILDVAGALGRVGVNVSFEFVEDLLVGLAEGIGQNVESPAMGHADDRFPCALICSSVEEIVEHRND